MRTWTISDIDGANERQVTLAQLRAELDACKAMVAPISAALRCGDLAACERAQIALRKEFSVDKYKFVGAIQRARSANQIP